MKQREACVLLRRDLTAHFNGFERLGAKMNLINDQQLVQEKFRATPYDLKKLQNEELITNRESAIAKDCKCWDRVERRKVDRNKRDISKLTYTQQIGNMSLPTGALSSGRMGLELPEEKRQIIAEPISSMKWWIEIFTAQPFCLYYFGDFQTFQQARILKQGFKQDLLDEGATIISLAIKYCAPQQLTIRSSELTNQEFDRLQSELIYHEA